MQRHTRRNRVILGLLLLAVVALTANPAQAFVSGPGPLYPAPAWDQIKGAGRFVVLTNWNSEAVLDQETGLVWERSPNATAQTWADARGACTGLTTGNRKGWRLPSVHELASLIDPSVASPGPTLPAGHPFTGIQKAGYWAASSYVDSPTLAWSVFFRFGIVDGNLKSDVNIAWCVRGGMNAKAY
jgi:hypothetical protein